MQREKNIERRLRNMDENKKEEQTPNNAGEGMQPKATLYEQTNAATKRLEEANAKTEELLNRQEELYQNQKLGGITEAGIPNVPEMSEEEKATKERIMAVGRATGAKWAIEQ